MADNRITINAEFGQNYKDLGFIGRVGENDSREIVFDCADALKGWPLNIEWPIAPNANEREDNNHGLD